MPRGRQRPRRGRGEGSITWREDLRLYQGSISLGKTGEGKRHRPTVYAKTKQEVLAKLQELRRTERPTERHTGDVTFGVYAEQWVRARESSQSPNSIARYRANLKNLYRHLEHESLTGLTPTRVERLYQEMLAAGHSPQEVWLCSKLLTTLCRSAVRAGLLAGDPTVGVARPRFRRRTITPYTPEQVQRLLAAAKADRHLAAYVLAIDSGMRKAELLGLEWTDFDWTRSTVRIERQVRRRTGGTEVAVCKTPRSRRTIRLSASTLAVMRAHQQTQEARGLGSAPVFCRPNGRHYWPNNFGQYQFYRLLERAGLPKIHFHDLRHTCATLLLLLDERTHVVSERLGHSLPSTTINIYQHLLDGMQEGAATKLDSVLAPALASNGCNGMAVAASTQATEST